MRVVRNFDEIYEKEQDPWSIGKADSDRYNFYYDLILKNSRQRKTLLDVGCGFGALLSRFKDDFKKLNGVEISTKAIEKGRDKYPFIHFEKGSADRLSSLPDQNKCYGTIIYSDVIYYLTEDGKNSSLKWIASHLEEDGLAFIAAWAPGKRYLAQDEFRRLVRRYFIVEDERFLKTEHAVFLCRKKKNLIAITIDYETWHPIPEGMKINWEEDVFGSAEKMMAIADSHGVKLTFMAEMGEYFWLLKNESALAKKMEEQWESMVKQGHDVQLHLHPNWLPELGARFENGQWVWDWTKSKANDYPGDLTKLLGNCKSALEKTLQPVKADYRVTSFRAGAYQAQPFSRLYEALIANGIFCDSSVYKGGFSRERGYDYREAFSEHQPYYPDSSDPKNRTDNGEKHLIEIPIFTYAPNQRWFLDGEEGNHLSSRLSNYLEANRLSFASSEVYRFRENLKKKLGFLSDRFPIVQGLLNKLMLRDEEEPSVGHEYFVMIGHTKGVHDFKSIGQEIKKIKDDGRFEFVTLSQMVETAQKDLKAYDQPLGSLRLARAMEWMDWVYRSLNPERSSESIDPNEILAGGYAFCLGYAIVLGKKLQKEGYPVRWLSMIAQKHPRGRGLQQEDSHEVLLVTIDGREIILDPMANTCIPHSLKEVLEKPELAVAKAAPDARYNERRYELYDTSFWYSRVDRYAIRRGLGKPFRWRPNPYSITR